MPGYRLLKGCRGCWGNTEFTGRLAFSIFSGLQSTSGSGVGGPAPARGRDTPVLKQAVNGQTFAKLNPGEGKGLLALSCAEAIIASPQNCGLMCAAHTSFKR